MRYDVRKFLFVGAEKDRDLFFQRAQEAGIIHFINSSKEVTDASHEIPIYENAIKIVRGLPVHQQEMNGNAKEIAERVVELNGKLNLLLEEERTLTLELSRVEIFGDFSWSEMRKIERESNRTFQFFCAKQGMSEHEDLPEELIYIGSNQGLDYFVAINSSAKQYPNFIPMNIERPLGELKKRSGEVSTEIKEIEGQLKNLSKFNKFLHEGLAESLNNHELEKAKKGVDFPIEKGNFFVTEGWVPTHKLESLQGLTSELNVVAEEVKINEDDVVPTYLENHGAARIGEDLVRIYDTPSLTDKDPSMWVLVSFAFFFAMIIGDAGYGLILLLVALYIRHKHRNLKNIKKRMLNLFTILSFSIIAWGVLTTSFFGISVPLDSPLRKVSLMSWLVEKKADYHLKLKDGDYQGWVKKYPEIANAQTGKEFLRFGSVKQADGSVNYEVFNKFSDGVLMELALLIGVIHITLSMARYATRNLSQIGWIIFLIGGYLYTPIYLGVASIPNYVFGIPQKVIADNALYMVYGGATLAVTLAIFKHKLFGLLDAPMNIIQIFGDVLSYLRLYALGFSGSLLTATVMDLAAGVPFIFGVIIIVLGHAINIVLGIMGGVVHGLRLNFLEWYHYSFEGGGKKFTPLKKLDIE